MLLYLIWHQAKLHSMDVMYKYGDIKHVAELNDSVQSFSGMIL